jgi:hypothetical protein
MIEAKSRPDAVVKDAATPVFMSDERERVLRRYLMGRFQVGLGLLCLFLLSCGGDPNQELLEATKAGDVGRVQSVLGGDVNINTQDADGKTALMLASESGNGPAGRL